MMTIDQVHSAGSPTLVLQKDGMPQVHLGQQSRHSSSCHIKGMLEIVGPQSGVYGQLQEIQPRQKGHCLLSGAGGCPRQCNLCM